MEITAHAAHSGQASAEFTGLVVVIAVAMAALALAVSRGAPLLRDAPVPLPEPRVWLGPAVPSGVQPLRRSLRHHLPDGWSPAELRRWYAEAPTWVRTALLNVVAVDGAAEEVADDLRALAADPAGYLAGRAAGPSPSDAVAAVAAVRGLPGYLRGIRRMGFDRGSERAAHDLGHLAGRAVIEWFARPARVARVLRRLPWRPGGG